jgi:hypothetical protein
LQKLHDSQGSGKALNREKESLRSTVIGSHWDREAGDRDPQSRAACEIGLGNRVVLLQLFQHLDCSEISAVDFTDGSSAHSDFSIEMQKTRYTEKSSGH